MWRLVIVFWFLFVIQTTWFSQPVGWLGGARLELPLLLVISVGLLWGARIGLICGLAAGLLSGNINAFNPGSFAVSRMLVGGVCGLFDQRFSRDNPVAVPLCMAGGTVGAHAIFGLMSPESFAQPLGHFLSGVLLNTVVGTLLHLGLLYCGLAPRDPQQEYLTQEPARYV
jgi:hypothetical protein